MLGKEVMSGIVNEMGMVMAIGMCWREMFLEMTYGEPYTYIFIQQD